MNYKNLQNNCFKSGACPKAGIKIHETNSVTNSRQTANNNEDLFRPSTVRTPVNFYQTSLNHLDLELDHYSLEDLYKLFNILEHDLSENVLKNAKQIVYKMHPDKSQLDPKYFRFFSAAYKRIYSIFEFQNKSLNKRIQNDDYYD